MKRLLKISVIFSFLYSTLVFADTNLCSSSGILKALNIIYFIIQILKILAPVFIIITGIKSLLSCIFNNDDKLKESVAVLITKVMIGAFIFFIPTVFYNIFDSLSQNNVFKEFRTCNECLFSHNRCDSLISNAETLEQKELEKKQAYIKQLKEKVAEEKAKEAEENKKKSEEASKKALSLGSKYNLTELELLQIANQCQHEQGTPVGAAAEASLMANRFELYPSSTNTTLYTYIKNAGWWAHSKTNMSGTPEVSSSIVEAVRQVLVYGNRTLPLYVDEHDCIGCGDVTSVTNNGVAVDRKDRSKYISGVSIIKNRYGATYTFYSFPTSSSDPFGYTNTAYNKVKG